MHVTNFYAHTNTCTLLVYYCLLHTNDSPLLRFHRLTLAMLTHLEGVSTATQLMSAEEEILSPTSDILSANISIVRGDYT